MENIDIFADGNDPVMEKLCVVRFYVPGARYHNWAEVIIDEIGYCELQDWRWNGLRDKRGGYRLSDPEDKARWDAEREVWQWLSEWDLVALKPIGPEDSEWFATEELLQRINNG